MIKADKIGGENVENEGWLKSNVSFTGELWLGHLRYGTFGKNSIQNCAPSLRQNNWKSKNLILAGNFNMTNLDDLFGVLIDLGQSPKEKSRNYGSSISKCSFFKVQNRFNS